MGAEMGGRRPQAKDTWSPQELEEIGRTLPWSLWRELGLATLLVSDLASRIGRRRFLL